LAEYRRRLSPTPHAAPPRPRRGATGQAAPGRPGSLTVMRWPPRQA
jgi:hypothetical protein